MTTTTETTSAPVLHTYIGRKAFGDKSWKARTTEYFEIHGVNAQLEVETSKNDDGTISTTASVGWPKDGGVTHRLSFGRPGGDFYRTIAKEKTRCTEKAVTAQHEQAKAVWNTIKALALEFYTDPESVYRRD